MLKLLRRWRPLRIENLRGTFPFLLPHISVALLIVIYALIQIQHFTPAYQEVDPDGYLLLAKRMARLQPLAVKDDDPFMYQTHQWVETPEGKVIPKFSPGYPLLMAVFYRLGGDEAMFLVSPLMGGLTLLGAYLLFQLWMSPLAAALATWALGINPMFLIYFGYLLTHASNTCFVTWGMFFLWRWMRGKSDRSAIWAGLLLGYAVTIRHTSLLLGSAVLIAAVGRCIDELRNKGQWSFASVLKYPGVRQAALLLVCYAIFPLLMAVYNWVFFGNPFLTGYGLTHEQDAFSFAYFRQNLSTMLNGLNSTALFLIFPLGFMGMLLIGSIKERLIRLSWFLPIVLLYTSYYWAPSGMPYLRFTIVTFPVVIGSAFLLLESATRMVSKQSSSTSRMIDYVNQGALVVFLVLLVFLRYGEAQRGMRSVVSDPGSRATAAVARMLTHTLQPDAVIFSQRPFFCYIGTREDFRLYDLQVFQKALNYSVRRQPKRTERLRKFYESLDEAGKLRKKRELVRSFIEQSRQVVFLIPSNALAREQEQLGTEFKFTLLKTWQARDGSTEWGIYAIGLYHSK